MKRWYTISVFFILTSLLAACTDGGDRSGSDVTTLSTSKDITAFSFKNPAAIGIINNSAKTIFIEVPHGTNVTSLVAVFTTTGTTVKVGNMVQVNGATPNNFTTPVTYTVTAADSSTITYTVTVTVATINIPRTGQTTSYAARDDGDIKAGIAWPVVRFSVASSGTGTVVTDNLTGLMWTSDASTPTIGACTGGSLTWQEALDYAACLNTNSYLGHTDWRLPNRIELQSLINYEQPNFATWLNTQGFTNVQANDYWSSNTWASGAINAWFVRMSNGYVFLSNKSNLAQTWPVRDAGVTSTISLPRTGQTTSYATGDDGDKKAGTAWPTERFSVVSIGTGTVVTDNLTGLIWPADAISSTIGTCVGGLLTWQEALDYVACLNANNYLGFTDWRLPNTHELQSLIHMEYTKENNCSSGSCSTISEWLNTQGFSSVRDGYWSSTTFGSNNTFAWENDMVFGVASHVNKSSSMYVWPVHGGQ